MLSLLAAGALAITTGCLPPPGGTMYVEYANLEPPPAYVEVVGLAPGPGYVWVAGYWGWGGGSYRWVPGRWDVPPRGHRSWVAPQWRQHGHGRWAMRPGHWR
jgi:hypothetical protein